MEWLINRRRMMFNRVIPPDYLTFEDSRVWELCCYNFGNTKLVRGSISQGTINTNGQSLIYSDYIFADCKEIPEHKSHGRIINIPASGQEFSITFTVHDDSIFNSFSSDATVIEVSQYTDSLSKTILYSITKEDFISNAVDGVISASVTTTNACVYLRVGVLGENDNTVDWNIVAVSGNYQPEGITLKQCESVSTLGNTRDSVDVFSDNKLIQHFEEFVYFKNITIIDGNSGQGWNRGFCDCTNLTTLELPESVITLGDYTFSSAGISILNFKNVQNIKYRCFMDSAISQVILNDGFLTIGSTAFGGCSNITYIDLPSTIQSISTNNFNRGKPVLVCRATTPPTLGTGNTKPSVIYVPQSSVEDYKAATNWSAQASKIQAIEGTWYETHRSLEPTT